MTEREFYDRVLASANGGPNLGEADDRRLDDLLEASCAVRHVVASSPEDELSLAWRSELNEKLLALARPVKKSRWALAWRPATALAVTAALALTFVLQLRTTPSGEFEKGLIELHFDSERSLDMAGVGVAMPEVASHRSSTVADDVGFEQVDLELL
ncbi:MAG: hypothetical protein KIS66_14155 [Fimbriimonadaceae bacterium]|nr:hypothetical protein [Fimbriimonadaceae bacterium]